MKLHGQKPVGGCGHWSGIIFFANKKDEKERHDLQALDRTKLASNGCILQGSLQVLHIHALLVSPLGAGHMAQPGTDQHQNRVAVRETAHYTRKRPPFGDLFQHTDTTKFGDVQKILAQTIRLVYNMGAGNNPA